MAGENSMIIDSLFLRGISPLSHLILLQSKGGLFKSWAAAEPLNGKAMVSRRKLHLPYPSTSRAAVSIRPARLEFSILPTNKIPARNQVVSLFCVAMVRDYDSSEELFYCPNMISYSCHHGGRSGFPALLDIIDLEAQ
jgi:hypothetical protein